MNKKLVVLGVVGVLGLTSLVSTSYNQSNHDQEVLVPTATSRVPIVGTAPEIAKINLSITGETKVIKTLKVDPKRTVRID